MKVRESIKQLLRDVRDIREQVLQERVHISQKNHKNPLNRAGGHSYSQTDEDGILIEILRRLGKLESGCFGEFGVGDGTENNSLVLKALGWKGFWVGGEELAFNTENASNFIFTKDWITRENILDLTKSSLDKIQANDVDVLSLDLDGNDYYLIEELLKNNIINPSLYIVEYNARFLPPIKFKIEYAKDHTWQGNDYFGASLQSFIDLFSQYNYSLICCNSHTGANAFFVKNDHLDSFQDVPREAQDLYMPPNYFLRHKHGHLKSLKTIESFFQDN